MPRILVFCSLVVVFACSVAWMAQQPGARGGDESHFTGTTATMDAAGATVTRRRFEAGARTAWHSHPHGQLLFVEEGRARIQKRGQPFKDMGPGQSDYTGPNVVHWHGAAPSGPLVHVAVGFGGETKWLEKVTDAEYLGKAR
jgi:quercetin dioxygenase-like cupin family protein